MARETSQTAQTSQQKDKRAQSKQKTSAGAQTARGAGDRQAPIQTSRDQNLGSGRSEQSQQSQQIRTNQPSGAQTPGTESRSASQQTSGVVRQGTGAARHVGPANPFELMQRMSDDMDRLFQQFGFGRSGIGLGPILGSSLGFGAGADRQPFGGESSLWAPQVETARRGDRFVIRADLPGIKKDDVRVEVNDDVIAISGERRSQQQEERDGLFRSERSYGSFYRAIPLPEGANADQCEARFNDGVLEISLPAPKSEQRTPRHIEIR